MENRLKIAADLAAKLKINININDLCVESQFVTPEHTVTTSFYHNDVLFLHSQSKNVGLFIEADSEEEELTSTTDEKFPLIVSVYSTYNLVYVKRNLIHAQEPIMIRAARKFDEWYKLDRAVPSSEVGGLTYTVHQTRIQSCRVKL